MIDRFEEAFVQCLKDGVYPGPSNINERYRKDKQRINKLNGEKSKQRLALMHAFGIEYQRGRVEYTVALDSDGYRYQTQYTIGIPKYPYIPFHPDDNEPEPGFRKHEIQDPNQPWKLKRR